ncbi:hypothetical protein LSTR_LSTR007598 [Laodelphax striatellus]|uniref:Protein giant-lens n=1 Tax=Laodelphax striatellus TaxID=195883 RepID=A0A482XKZ9_LAOST|nr:hypothetical protein LSTR_LSTR007598 [Laodelphax striatellus]
MLTAGASERFLLIIFLQLLRSTTTSPSPATTLDDSKLPLIVFQQHHHHHHLGELPTTEMPPSSQDDYYAYNVAAKVGASDVTEIRTNRKHHYKHDDDDSDDDGEEIRGKKHHSTGAVEFNGKTAMRTLYQVGDSDSSLPECGAWAVCGKVDVYEPGRPWLEKQCRCPQATGATKGGRHTATTCSQLLTAQDGHTVVDKTRHYKVCEPVRRLPRCRYFRDVTWTLRSTAENGTQQTMHCLCPKGAVAYLIKRQAYQTSDNAIGYQYSFACSPQSRLRCQRKEPCRLFTVRKRQELLDEVNTNTLCQCPHGHTCPTHHTHQPGVVQGKTYLEENVRTYSGYCLPSN